MCYECNEPGHKRPDCPRRSQQQQKFEKSSFNKNCSLLTAFSFSADHQSWFLDSAVSVYMTGTKDWLSNFDSSRAGLKITVANNEKLCSTGSGDVQVKVNDKINCISNVLHVPNLSTNLLSSSGLVAKGFVVVFNSTGCQLFWNDDYAASGMVVATAFNHQGLYMLDMEQQSHAVTAIQPAAMAVKTPADLWHHRLGHLCHYEMNLLRRGLAEGVTYNGWSEDKCISCLEGKQSCLPVQKGKAKRAKERLEIVHTDLCGPMSVESLHGHNYMLLFMDDFTRKVFPYFLKTKDEVKSKFLIFKVLVENETGLKIKVLQSDNGTEYVNKDLENYLVSEGIRHQTTIPSTPEQNGVAEQTNRSVIEKTRCKELAYPKDFGNMQWKRQST
jgi:hypothetical protein